MRVKSDLMRWLYCVPNLIKLWKFKKRYKYFVDSEAVLKRKSDGTLWIASHGGPQSLAALFTGKPSFYFRRCKPFRSGYIIDWKQTWEFEDITAFNIYDNKYAV